MTKSGTQFDTIVIGLGAMGSATLDQLARRGSRVLGIEQYGIPHDLGSSGGDTRLIRKAYYEHPDYVPLLARAYENWDDLGRRTGEQVLFRTGALYVGKPDSALITGSRTSARLHGLECPELDARGVSSRWPFRVPNGYVSLHETDGGFVLAAKSIRLYCEQALVHGAEVRAAECVHTWRETRNGVEVSTSDATYRAQNLVVTAGSWASEMLPKLGTSLTVTRQLLFWLWPAHRERFVLERFPCWAAQLDGYDGLFYGFPMLPAAMGGQLGLKLAHHVTGQSIRPGEAKPAQVSEFVPVRKALKEVFAGELGPVVATKTCMYTSSVDQHFIVDRYPSSERVFVACGFSGHGFKFASVIGEVLADFATTGTTRLPVGFLSLARFK
jgi:sarcosine oxidase